MKKFYPIKLCYFKIELRLVLSCLILLVSCRKNEEENKQVFEMQDVKSDFVTHNSAHIVAEVTPFEKLLGICAFRVEYYDTNQSGIIHQSLELDFKINQYSDFDGPAVIYLSNLETNTTYKAKVYLDVYEDYQKIERTWESEEIVFTTKSVEVYTDHRDGNAYQVARIGDRIWFLENLRYQVEDESWDVKGMSQDFEKYGLLYTYEGARDAVPDGWRIPSEDDWNDLRQAVGLETTDNQYLGSGVVGKLMEPGKRHWDRGRFSTNETGFSAIPAGVYIPADYNLADVQTGVFEGFGIRACFYSSIEYPDDTSRIYLYQIDDYSFQRLNMPKELAFSVRCVKDVE